MRWGVDWSQASTWRGAIWSVAGVFSLGLIAAGRAEAAPVVIAIAEGVAGGLGVALKD